MELVCDLIDYNCGECDKKYIPLVLEFFEMIHPCSDDELEKVRVSLNDMKARLHLSLPDKSNESMYGEG